MGSIKHCMCNLFEFRFEQVYHKFPTSISSGDANWVCGYRSEPLVDDNGSAHAQVRGTVSSLERHTCACMHVQGGSRAAAVEREEHRSEGSTAAAEASEGTGCSLWCSTFT